MYGIFLNIFLENKNSTVKSENKRVKQTTIVILVKHILPNYLIA